MKSKNIISIVLVLCLASSCESFLDLKPISNKSDGSYYGTTEEIAGAVLACYNGMLDPIRQEWALTELRSDNSRVYTSNSGSTGYADLRDLDVAIVYANNKNVSSYWNAVYSNIDRCNKVINNIDVVTSPDLKKFYLGQVLFIRAYHYFNLVRLFGGVFLVEGTLATDVAAKKQRNSVEEVYALIERDLARVVGEDMLPDSYDAKQAGLVSMVAAKTTLARVYATNYLPSTALYIKALNLLDEAIAAMGAPLTASDLVPFNMIFSPQNKMNKEIVFAVRFKSGGYGTGSPFSNSFAPAGSGINVVNMGGASGGNFPSDLLLKAYDSQLDTIRPAVNYQMGYINKISSEWIETETSRFVKKYMTPVFSANDADTDWPVIRVSDILLLYAEIDNEINGPTTRSVNYVNMVRDRAAIGHLSGTKRSNKYEFRNAIQDERQLELALENHRWFDLLRTNMALDVLNRTLFGQQESIYGKFTAVTIRPTTSNDLLLPIPQDVFDINPNVSQNPGY